MLSLSLITLGLAAIGAYAKPTVRAVDGLELFLSTPADKVVSVSDLRVVATVKNVGYEDLKILKLGTVLDDEHPTHAFIVTKDGKEVPFIGTTVPTPTDGLSEDDWVVIPAGENLTSEHDVSALYDFSGSGLGTFTFDSVSTFQAIGLDDSVETASSTIPIVIADAHSVSITITDNVSKRELKHLQIKCDDPDRQLAVNASITEAKYMASVALSYIRERGYDQLYNDYFGTRSTIPTVIANFESILYANSTKVDLLCSGSPKTCGRTPEWFAYRDRSEISYCDSFYDQRRIGKICDGSTSDRDFRGGTTLRMLATVFFKAVDDRNTCRSGRALDVPRMLTTAGNYECYATQAILRTKC